MKKIFSAMMALIMVCSLLSVTALAAASVSYTIDTSSLSGVTLQDSAPNSSSSGLNLGSATTDKDVGDTGFYQRCPYSGFGNRTYYVSKFAVASSGAVRVTDTDVIGNITIGLETYDATPYKPALTLNYDVVGAGSTTVTFTFYYNYNLTGIGGGTTWYKETMTFTVNVAEPEPESYTVTYSDGVATEAIFTTESYTVEEGSETPEFEGDTTRDGYTFEGWSPDVADTVTGDANYIATWEEVVVEEVEPLEITLTGGDYGTETQGTYGNEYLDLDIDVTGGVAPYTVTCRNAAGDVDMDTSTLRVTTSGQYVVDVEDAAGTTDSACVNVVEVTFNSDGGSEVPSQLLGKPAEEISIGGVTVTDDLGDGGTVLLSEVSVQDDANTPLASEPADPTKDGYSFAGWTLNGDAYDFNTQVSTSMELVATWTENTVPASVTYVANLDETVTSFPADYTGEVGETIILAEPAQESDDNWTFYFFTGWVDDAGVSYDADDKVTLAGDVTFTAQWAKMTVNGDGFWTYLDAMAIMDYLAAAEGADFVYALADRNNDGADTYLDAMAVMDYLAESET